ncbi:MAG: sigma-70 family RNA polymerase sigma factor [Pirellula sp.]|jgi:RNA polymerase sigma-70 factor (ECF subfamily)
MSNNRDSESESKVRERMTRHWLEAEQAVRAYIAGAVRSFVDREDLLQQVALTIARRFDEFDEQRPFLAWALWLAKSRVIDFYRSQNRHQQFLSESLLDKFADTLVQRQEVISRRHEALEHCLEKLPERSRELIRFKYQEGLRIEQIAETIRSTSASVRVALYRVRNALADCIQARLASESTE